MQQQKKSTKDLCANNILSWLTEKVKFAHIFKHTYMNTYILICVLIINMYLNFKDVRKGVRGIGFEAENLMMTRKLFFLIF